MAAGKTNPKRWIAIRQYSTLVSYGAAVLSVWVALSLWSLSPVLRREPFMFFLIAVVVTARFFGSGPALLCLVLSALCIDVIVLPPTFSFSFTALDLERLGVFVAVAILVSSLARQKTQAELRGERARRETAAIVEDSDDAIFSTNPHGTIVSWNRGAERLYGYPAEEAVGAPVTMLSPPERREEAIHNQSILSLGGRVESHQTERMKKDGTRVPVVLTISPLRSKEGEIVGASAVARDLSVQKQSEEAVRRSEKLASAGRLAASVAHEINNPLEAVLNLLYLARHNPERVQQYLSMAETEVHRVASLAQQTLGFVRDTANPSVLDPAAIMDETLTLYSHKLATKGIHVARRYTPKVEISGYSGEVRQLLANLVVNAVDAMEQGGILQVRVEAGREWSTGKDGVRITVADNGSGIPADTLPRIFEPFYTTKVESGTGLGLWVSRGIVQKHSGSIRVRSRVDGERSGTVFSVFLPFAHQAAQVA